MRVISICFLLCFFSAIGFTEENRTKSATETLDSALQWMFEVGIPQYYSGTDAEQIKNIFLAETQARMPTVIHESQNEHFNALRFWIDTTVKDPVSNKSVTKIWDVMKYTTDIKNDVLEYWVIKVIDRTYVGEGCFFIITQAENLQSRRKIVLHDTQYIKSTIVAGHFIQFPEDDLYLLYILEAWRFPMSFNNSNLKNYIVKFSRGLPYLKKIGMIERQYLNWYYKIP
jgi:hypothetical protein